MNNKETVYGKLKAAGCKIDNHQSDLYVEDTPEAREILHSFDLKIVPFKDEVTGTMWLEAAFMYQPFWDRLSSATDRS